MTMTTPELAPLSPNFRLQYSEENRWPSGKASEGFRLETRFPEDPPCIRACCTLIICNNQTSSLWWGAYVVNSDTAYPIGCKAKVDGGDPGVVWKYGEWGVAAQVSPSSSDRCSKLCVPSQTSPGVASKRAVNITKMNYSNRFRDYQFWTILHRKGLSGNESYERISGVLRYITLS
ncbi:hypothetical protein AVEN_170841-1 [Araneus ventricosus]|uniref:Uncharacterized protein n=1 Tax=Araneus ventricosus TaxID=182803 RepID=A0A4Y2HTX4_ARAVE|nr:hypothetical protein AVEN_170841-1 [Araneus ventricosus]